jgi:acyl-CoA thioester hydrolase
MHEHIHRTRVYYDHTDAGGVVYHADYLKFMEHGRTEWLRELGFEQDSLRDELGLVFAVRRVEIDYIAPARFNQRLAIHSRIEDLRRASMVFDQTIVDAESGGRYCTAKVRVVCVSIKTFKPAPMPAEIMGKIKDAS